MLITLLKLGIGVDLSALDTDLELVERRFSDAGRSAIISPRTKSGGGGIEAQADGLAHQFHALGGTISGSLSRALAAGGNRTSALLAHIDVMTDRMGGTFDALSKRIDSAMKFPWWDKTIGKLKDGLSSFGNAAISGVGKVKNATATLPPILKALLDELGLVKAAASAPLPPILAELGATAQKIPARFERIATQARLAGAAIRELATLPPPAENRAQRKARLASERGAVPGVGQRIPLAGDTKAFDLKRAGGGPTRLAAAFRLLDAAIQGTSLAAFVMGETVLRSTSRSLGVVVAGYHGWIRVKSVISSAGDVSKKTFSQIYAGGNLLTRPLGAVLGFGLKITGLSRLHLPFTKAAAEAKRMGDATRTTGAQVSSMKDRVVGLGSAIVAAFGFVGIIYKAVTFLRDGVKSAAALNEAVSASKEVFGNSYGVVEKQVESLSQKYRVNKKAQLDAANAFGALAQGAGVAKGASAQFANKFTMLTADLVSFKDVSGGFEEAAANIRSALSGESEPLKKFGILIDEDKVKAEAMALGLASVSRSGKSVKVTLDDNAKMMARASLISKGLATATGDLERTQGSAANQFRKAGGGIQAFGEAIGTALLPAVTTGTLAFNDFLEILISSFEASLPTVQTWVGFLQSGLAEVGRVVRNAGAYFQILKLRAGAFGAYVVEAIGIIPSNFALVTDYVYNNWSELLTDIGTGASAAFTNLLGNAQRFGQALWAALKGEGFNFNWTPLLEGFRATAAEFPTLAEPAWLDIEADVARIMEGVNAKEAKRTAALDAAGKAGVKEPAGEAAKKVDPYEAPKLAAGVSFDSKEAYSAVAKNSLGDRGNKTGDIAKNTREQVRQGAEQLATLKTIAAKGIGGGVAVGAF